MIPKKRLTSNLSRATLPLLCRRCGKPIRHPKRLGRGKTNYSEVCRTCLNR